MLKIIKDSLSFFQSNKQLLRTSILGYHKLKNSNNLDYILKIRKVISNTNLINNYNSKKNSFFFGASNSNIQLSLHQFLLTRLVTFDLNKQILSSIYNGKKIIYPLPYEWRLILEEKNIISNSILNKIYWIFYVITIFIYGIFQNLKYLFCVFISFLNFNKKEINSGVYFHKLETNNLPFFDQSGVIYWYHKVLGSKENNIFYFHDKMSDEIISNKLNIKFLKYPFLSQFSLKFFFNYLIWFISRLFFSLLEFAKGNFHYMLLFNEATLSYLYRSSNVFFKKALFNQTGYLYKPLWTYELEKKGGEAVLYFYATNIETIKFKNQDFIQDWFWEHCNWKKYYLWDNNHYQFLKKNIKHFFEYEILGPVEFLSNTKSNRILSLTTPFISIFDVQPHRTSFYYSCGLSNEYYTAEVALDFINHIYEIALNYNISVIHKRKRKNEINRNIKYMNKLKQLNNKANFSTVDPDIPANKIIDLSSIVISMPFTSTSIYAKSKNKPTIFYDPTLKIDKSFHKFDGIEIISGKPELEKWFSNFFKKK